MKTWTLAIIAATAAWGQEFQNLIPFEQLQTKAEETVEVNLDGNMLAIAKKFLSDNDPEQAEAKKILDGVRGIYVRVLKFKKDGEYSIADVEKLRNNVKAPGWQRIVDVRSSGAKGDNAGVFMKTDGNEIQGILVLAAEARELAIVNIVGNIQPEQIRKLSGMGLPGLSEAGKAMEKAKPRTQKKDDE
jgi:hypothetical protein